MKKDEAIFNKGLTLLEQNSVPEALACFEQAVRLNPQRSEYFLELGATYQKVGELAKSLDCFQKGVALNP